MSNTTLRALAGSIEQEARTLLAQAHGLYNLADEREAAKPTQHGRRWTSNDDHYLATYWGPSLRHFSGDAEAAIAALARDLGRTPVAVAIRLCVTGVFNLR